MLQQKVMLHLFTVVIARRNYVTVTYAGQCKCHI